MTLYEWNKLIEHGKHLCTKLNVEGHNVVLKSYTLYDGRRGLKMQVLDALGEVHREYYSGIDQPHIMQITMETNARKIRQECK